MEDLGPRKGLVCQIMRRSSSRAVLERGPRPHNKDDGMSLEIGDDQFCKLQVFRTANALHSAGVDEVQTTCDSIILVTQFRHRSKTPRTENNA